MPLERDILKKGGSHLVNSKIKTVLATFLWIKLKISSMKVTRCVKVLLISKFTDDRFNFLNFPV